MTALRNVTTEHEGHILERLAAIEPGEHWIVSCYVPLSPELRAGGKYILDLKNRVREASARLATMDVGRSDTEQIGRDVERIVAAVADRKEIPDAPGVAFFACEASGLFLSVSLPRSGRARLVIDHVPHLRELRAAESEFGRVATVVVDRDHTRIFDVSVMGAVELPRALSVAPHGGKFHSDRHGSPGSGEKEYHHRIEQERERHYEAIVQRLMQLDHERPFRGLIIAGHVRETSGFARFLDGTLLRRLIGTARVHVATVTAATVKNLTFSLCAEHDHQAERTEVARLLESAGEGWAVNGVQATMRALSRGQLRSLFVRAETDAAEADEAIEEALGQRVRVVLLHDPETAEKVLHLGGFLRFK